MHQHVEPDNIGGAERGRLRPADGRAGAGVNFFDGEVHLAHQAQHVEHGKSADAIGDEVGRVLGNDHAFAHLPVAEVAERGEHIGARLGPGDQLDQLHVARRVEEMRAGPVLLEIVRAAFRDKVNRQA